MVVRAFFVGYLLQVEQQTMDIKKEEVLVQHGQVPLSLFFKLWN